MLTAPASAEASRATANNNHDASEPCKNGGWQNYMTTSGDTFRNQGACVSYAVHGGTLVPIAPPADPPVITSFAQTASVVVGTCPGASLFFTFTGTFSGGTGVITDALGGTHSATSGVATLTPPVPGTITLTVTGPGGTVSSVIEMDPSTGTQGPCPASETRIGNGVKTSQP